MVELNSFKVVVSFPSIKLLREKVKLVKQLKMSAIIKSKIRKKKKRRSIYEVRDLSIGAFK